MGDLLGGTRVLRRQLRSSLDAHEMILKGLPGNALSHLIDNFVVLRRTASFEKVAGMSLRTFQRRKGAPLRPLSPEQSGRTWKFAEVLAKATAVLGSRKRRSNGWSVRRLASTSGARSTYWRRQRAWRWSRTSWSVSSTVFTCDPASGGAWRQRACGVAPGPGNP